MVFQEAYNIYPSTSTELPPLNYGDRTQTYIDTDARLVTLVIFVIQYDLDVAHAHRSVHSSVFYLTIIKTKLPI